MITIYKYTVFMVVFIFLIFISWLQAQSDQPKLVDVTEKAGIDFIHSFGDGEMSNLIESSLGFICSTELISRT